MAGTVTKYDGFATRFGLLTATLGSAVGLGNIWKFPYMTGAGGGAAFLLTYCLATFVVGLPVMIAEIMLGREAKANTVAAWRKLSPKTSWYLVGVAGVLAAFLIVAFYSDVVGWVFSFIVRAACGELNTVDPKVSEAAFLSMVSDPWHALFWQWGVLVCIGAILVGGVSKGIEKTTKLLMPVLFLMLVAVCVRSLMLPKAAEGLAFLFKPDFSKVTVEVVLNAMGLAFFKLSIGMGTMMTYGSYFRSDADIPLVTLRVMLADLLVSLLAGIAIFPAVFNYGFEPTAGPGLLFMTMPAVFSSLPMGQIFMTAFFLLTGIATVGAMMSLFEVPVALFSGSGRVSRAQAVVMTTVGLALFGVPATLSFSHLSDVTVFGKTYFDLYDFLSSNIIMPVGGICICIYVGWVWGLPRARMALSNQGALKNTGLISVWFPLVRYVTPLLIVLVLLKGLKLI